jgi:hypothetical protein
MAVPSRQKFSELLNGPFRDGPRCQKPVFSTAVPITGTGGSPNGPRKPKPKSTGGQNGSTARKEGDYSGC